MTWLRDFIAAWNAVIGPELRRAVEPEPCSDWEPESDKTPASDGGK